MSMQESVICGRFRSAACAGLLVLSNLTLGLGAHAQSQEFLEFRAVVCDAYAFDPRVAHGLQGALAEETWAALGRRTENQCWGSLVLALAVRPKPDTADRLIDWILSGVQGELSGGEIVALILGLHAVAGVAARADAAPGVSATQAVNFLIEASDREFWTTSNLSWTYLGGVSSVLAAKFARASLEALGQTQSYVARSFLEARLQAEGVTDAERAAIAESLEVMEEVEAHGGWDQFVESQLATHGMER